MTEFEIVKGNLPKVDLMAYEEVKESIQKILRKYHRFFLGRRNHRGILFVDSINIIHDEYIEVFVSFYGLDGNVQSTELVDLDRELMTDEEKLKEAIRKQKGGVYEKVNV